MQEHLATLAVVLRRVLDRELLSLGEGWWQLGVMGKLTYQQRAQADEYEWTSLDDLDVAALLRVVDQNWDLLRRHNIVKWEDRNWLKEASSVRNRYAHVAPGREPSPDRVYRDLDTVTLLAEALSPGSREVEELSQARAQAVARLTHGQLGTGGSEPAPKSSGLPAEMTPGGLVRVKARPELTGVITEIFGSGPQARLTVFHGRVTQTYFESQIERVQTKEAGHLSAETLRAHLTAAHVLQPSVSRLYSLNSGRIDYEPYQYRPVLKLINADRPRILIADDVGVGKTIEAGLIIKELQARQQLDSVLVVCPKPLVVEEKWRIEMRRFGEDFVQLDSAMLRHCIDEVRAEGHWPSRYRKAILPYSLLDEKLLLGDDTGRRPRPGLTSLMPPVKFDLVIVDEAHHVRNSDTWSHRVVKHLLDSAEAAVLISATPIQTGSEDLRTLLRLLRPDTFVDRQTFDLMTEPNADLAEVEAAIRACEEGWQDRAGEALEAALATPWGMRVLRADPRAQEVRDILDQDEVTAHERVAALRVTRSLNTFSSLINRTRRRDIESFTTRKPETFLVDFTPEQAAVHADLLAFAGRIAVSHGQAQSLNFLLSTLQRQAASCLNGLGPFIEDILRRRLSVEELSEADAETDELDASVLDEFGAEIRSIADRAMALTDDPKFERLADYVEEKRALPNNKLLVFSTFRHTLAYLNAHLASKDVRVGVVHGAVPDDVRRDLRARFAKDKLEHDAIDVLLSSEVGTEGLDYQFCDALVNYDLPWNPMRIEQRIGRIDRRGQPSESVAIKNFVVSGTVDAAIFNRCLARIGVFQRALGGSEAILGDLTREIRRIGEDLTLTAAERETRLQQLADNKLGRIQEQEELEESESALFGLSLRALDEEGVERATSPWLASSQLKRLVQRYLAKRGYEHVDDMFERPVTVLRPSKDVRIALIEDAVVNDPASSTPWMRWLETSGDTSRQLTFDPAHASTADVELLSPVHELVRAAAFHEDEIVADSTFAVKVRSDVVAPGIYPAAMYAWNYLGARDDFEVLALCPDPSLAEQLQTLLVDARDTERDAAPGTNLDDEHFTQWAASRATHIERMRVHVASQLASLTTTHQARTRLLEEQIVKASHANIRRMRESELRSLEDDFDNRRGRLEASVERCDITTALLCSGVIEVVDV